MAVQIDRGGVGAQCIAHARRLAERLYLFYRWSEVQWKIGRSSVECVMVVLVFGLGGSRSACVVCCVLCVGPLRVTLRPVYGSGVLLAYFFLQRIEREVGLAPSLAMAARLYVDRRKGAPGSPGPVSFTDLIISLLDIT